MATRPSRTRSRTSRGKGEPAGSAVGVEAALPSGEAGYTGRYLVLFASDAIDSGAAALTKSTGLKLASSSDFKDEAPTAEGLAGADGVLLRDIGVAVVDSPPQQISALEVSESSAAIAVEPERVVFALQDTPYPTFPVPSADDRSGHARFDYLKGYRDAVNHLYDVLTGTEVPLSQGTEAETAALLSEAEYTWGLQATKVPASKQTGKGIKVAVLDTGMDLNHPDFINRNITSASFIQNQTVQDGHGHGTHCIGTALGPKRPQQGPRYGIAYEADIFAGKVLSDGGSGGDGGILAGINWAVSNGCAVASMSLGAPVQQGQTPSAIFERVARRALAKNTLVIAAAGNDSNRPFQILPVSHPANCPSIMAVAAVDRNLRIASFSNGGLNAQGGHVDIAGPGVSIRSSWPRPALYRIIDGTSMATPHVAGIAALFAQIDPKFRGRALMSLLTQSALRLPLAARDVGAGLVQAP